MNAGKFLQTLLRAGQRSFAKFAVKANPKPKHYSKLLH